MNDAIVDHDDLRAALRSYWHFNQCLLTEARLADFGMTFELVFDFIWDAGGPFGGRVVPDPRYVTVRLEGLEEARIIADLPAALIEDPSLVGWGLSEVGHVDIEDDVRGETNDRVHHLSVGWEGEDRRIDVYFRWMRLVGEPGPNRTAA